MSPLSWPVVTGTLLVGSPAIYAARVADTLSVDTALIRLLICAAAVWAVCSMFASFSAQALETNRVQQAAVDQAAAEKVATERAAAEARDAEAEADASA